MRNVEFSYLRRSLFFFFLLLIKLSYAQNYGFEWIDFSKDYFKIQDARTGIFKITYQELAEAGFPVDLNPQEYQLFREGQEMAIRIIGESDGSFDAGDYILYYGQKMNGASDAQLYSSPSNLTNPYINLFSDTSAYFLTHSFINPKRIKTNSNENSTSRNYLEKVSQHTFLENYSLGDEPVS